MKYKILTLLFIIMSFSVKGQELWQLYPWALDSNYVIGALPSGEPVWIHKDSLGITGGGSGTIKGNGNTNKVAYWASSDSITHDTMFSFLPTNDRLGIGINLPTGLGAGLHLNGGTFTDLHLTNPTTGTASSDGTSLFISSTDAYLTNRENGDIVLATQNIERVRIDEDGILADDLKSGGTAPTTSGTLVKLVADAAGRISFQANNTGTFTLPALTSGSVLFSDGSTISQDNSRFFWNNTNKMLGIGTNSPTTYTPLTTAGSVIYHSSTPQFGMSNSTRQWVWYGSGNQLRLYNNQDNELLYLENDKVGIKRSSPARTLDILGTFRFSGSVGTADRILGRENSTGDVGDITIGNGLSLSANTLSVTSPLSGTEGEVTFWSSTNQLKSDADLFFREANNIFSVGTKTPISYTPLLNPGIVLYNATQTQLAMSNSSRQWLWYNTGTDLRLWNDSDNELLYLNGSRMGIKQSSPTRTLDINGEVRIRDLITDNPAWIVGADNDGDLNRIQVSTGLQLVGNTLSVNGVGTVTQVNTSNGITGGPIITSGTVQLTGQASELHNLNTNGLITRTSSGISARTITAGDGIAITNGNGVSGNPIISKSQVIGSIHRLFSSPLTTYNLTANTWNKLDFATVQAQDNLTASATTDDFTATVAGGSLFSSVECTCQFTPNGAGTYNFAIFRNGNEITSSRQTFTGTTGTVITFYLKDLLGFGTGDVVDVRARCNNTVSNNTIAHCSLYLTRQ